MDDEKSLLGLLDEAWSPEICIVFDEAPPEIGQRDGGRVPESMSINVALIWREVIDLQKHRKATCQDNYP